MKSSANEVSSRSFGDMIQSIQQESKNEKGFVDDNKVVS